MYKNSKGYPDPTAGTALEHIEYEERLKRRNAKVDKNMKLLKVINTLYCKKQPSTQQCGPFELNSKQY